MSKIDPKKSLPIIHNSEVIAKSRFFKIEQVDLEFSNGATRQFERMKGSGQGAVMIVPITTDQHMLLIREYAAGTHSYQLGFPKGLIDPGESPNVAANRELMEEVGFRSDNLTTIQKLSMAPTFFNSSMHLFIAQDLSPQTLEGDEPEPLEVIPWPLSDIDGLLAREDFTEARSVAALLLTQRWISNGNLSET
jgi:ADP-ribose diphosphatase